MNLSQLLQPQPFDQDAEHIWGRQYTPVKGESIDAGLNRVSEIAPAGFLRDLTYAMMASKLFCPGGRMLAGAGTFHRNIMNCFVYASDSGRYESLDDVQQLVTRVGLTTKVGGGNGVYGGTLAPKRAPFPRVDGPARVIATIHPDHPDAEDFFAFQYRDPTAYNGKTVQSPPQRGTTLAFWGESEAAALAGDLHLIEVPDNMRGILEAAVQMLRTLEAGNRVLLDFSGMRPEGSDIKGSGGKASGPSSFLIEIFDNFAYWSQIGGLQAGSVAFARYVLAPVLRVVRQGGVRRGAGMYTLPVLHGDVLDFLSAKNLDREADEGDISTFNISLLIPDHFMEAVERGEHVLIPGGLYFPEQRLKSAGYEGGYDPEALAQAGVIAPAPEGTYVSAKWLMAEIAQHAWSMGEPGLLFTDTINETNPLRDIDGNIVATNPCGEVLLYPGEPCDLGHIVLTRFVVDGKFQTDAFVQAVRFGVRFLDAALDYCQHPTEVAATMSRRNRRLGLGIMGLADALVKLGLRYGSEDAIQFTEWLGELMSEVSRNESEVLAAQLGEPEWSVLAREAGTIAAPRRNVATLTVAPTGTTSMVMGVAGGIEPIFSPFVYRKIGAEYRAMLSPLFVEELQKHRPHEDFTAERAYEGGTVLEWDMDAVEGALQTGHGSVQGLGWVPEPMRKVFVFAHDVTPEEHVKMQGAFQRGIDTHEVGNSISKTINLPNSATVQDVLDAYLLAYTEGCKGITVYRDGSRQFQVLSTEKNTTQTVSGMVGAQELSVTVTFTAKVATGVQLHASGPAFVEVLTERLQELGEGLSVPAFVDVLDAQDPDGDFFGILRIPGAEKPAMVQDPGGAFARLIEHAILQETGIGPALKPCPECGEKTFDKSSCVCHTCGHSSCG